MTGSGVRRAAVGDGTMTWLGGTVLLLEPG